MRKDRYDLCVASALGLLLEYRRVVTNRLFELALAIARRIFDPTR